MDGRFFLVGSGDFEELQKRFAGLPAAEQVEVLLQTRGKERLRYLFFSERPKELIEQLPEIEIFLTIKEVGKHDAVDLVSLLNHEQLQYLLDLDLWKRDLLDPQKVLHWMEILLESGEERVVEFIHATDPEFVTLLLMKFVHVSKPEEEPMEVLDRHPGFTLDREYFLTFTGSGSRTVIQPFLETLYHIDSTAYRLQMETLMRELESGLEEAAYRFRNARLADHGFPDFEEAMEIYQFLNPQGWKDQGPVDQVPPAKSEAAGAQPTFYLTAKGDGPFFSQVLTQITDASELARIRKELARLCNKAMIAEPIDLFEIGEMERVIKRGFHYLNLGLQYLSGEDEGRALQILRGFTLQQVFRSGLGVTLLLKKKAEKLLKNAWLGGRQEGLALLDPVHREAFAAILKKRPRVMRNGILDDFKDLRDVSGMEVFLGQIEAALDILTERLELTPDALKHMDLTGCSPDDQRQLTLSTLFITSLANQVLHGRLRFKPIGRSRLNELFSVLFERDEQGKGAVKMEIRHDLREVVESTEIDEQKREHLLAFWDFCLDLLEAGYGRIPSGEEVDSRFAQGLVIQE